MTDIINDPIYPFFQSTCTIAPPTITAGGPTTFCSGGSVTLTSSSGTSYLWSNGATTRSINVTASGNYTVKVTSPGGCQSTSSATVVTVNSLPATPTITAGGPTTFCTGGSVTLTSSPGTSYLWSNGAGTSSITVSTAGSYNVRVTNGSGCQSSRSVATIITVNSLPSTPIDHCQRFKNFLYRRQCNFDLECRFDLPVVHRCNHPGYKCYLIRKLFCQGNQHKWMSECLISSVTGNC